MKKRSLNYLKADVYRYSKTSGWKNIIKYVVINNAFRTIFTLRMCQHFSEKRTILSRPWLIIFIILHRYACNKAGVDLHWKTKIGPGFCITHGWGMVINSEAEIGSNVTVFHGATIGTKHTILKNGDRIVGYPTIGDNVWIGAHSVIIGNITIGDGSIIAPLSMIIKNVEAHTAVGCNPQKIIKKNVHEDVFNKVPLEKLSGI